MIGSPIFCLFVVVVCCWIRINIDINSGLNDDDDFFFSIHQPRLYSMTMIIRRMNEKQRILFSPFLYIKNVMKKTWPLVCTFIAIALYIIIIIIIFINPRIGVTLNYFKKSCADIVYIYTIYICRWWFFILSYSLFLSFSFALAGWRGVCVWNMMKFFI